MKDVLREFDTFLRSYARSRAVGRSSVLIAHVEDALKYIDRVGIWDKVGLRGRFAFALVVGQVALSYMVMQLTPIRLTGEELETYAQESKDRIFEDAVRWLVANPGPPLIQFWMREKYSPRQARALLERMYEENLRLATKAE